ncbi:MAG TPA: ComEA family DNA-binding protein [Nocardioidaceae bacterium]|nr:ComEA family DNA-binding protein [Nocardioidaceae bacterium]
MGSRKAANEQVAEVARRRLELLSAELAGIRGSLSVDGSADGDPEPTAQASTAQAPTGAQPASAITDATDPATTGKHAHRSIGLVGRIGGWAHDRLPPTLQGSVGLTSTHLTIVSLLVAAAMAVAAWWVLRADGAGTVVPTAVQQSSAAPTPLVDVGGAPSDIPTGAAAVDAQSPAATAPSPTAATAAIIIDVAGKVRRPGITTLPAGSRVADALKSAGGARKGVSLTGLNLARVLVDGEQIVVGIPPPSGVAAPAASAPVTSPSGSPGQMVNINTADEAELDTLPGVGPVTAQAIMTWRTENGAFTAVDELLEVSGIGDVTLAEMAPFVTI